MFKFIIVQIVNSSMHSVSFYRKVKLDAVLNRADRTSCTSMHDYPRHLKAHNFHSRLLIQREKYISMEQPYFGSQCTNVAKLTGNS